MVRRYALLLVTPALFAFQLPFSRNAQERPSEVQQLAMFSKPSVVRIISGCYADYRYQNEPKRFSDGSIGTGFFVDPSGYIVTNHHVIKPSEQNEQGCKDRLHASIKEGLTENGFSEDQQKTFLASEFGFKYYNSVYLPTGEEFKFEIKQKGSSGTASNDKDVAILKIEVSNAPVIKFADSTQDSVDLGDQVLVIGYPSGADLADSNSSLLEQLGSGADLGEATVSMGAISNPNKKLPESRAPVIQIDNVQVAPGSSGSPVLNQQGEVIGMITFYGDTQNSIPFAIAAPTIQEFINASGAVNEPGPTDALYREGLNLYWRGNLEGAKTKFEAVRSNFEYHSESNRLIRDIDQKLAIVWEQRNYTFWLALAAGAVVLLGAGYFLARWRTGSVALAGDSPDLFSPNTQFTEVTSRQPHSVTNTVMSFLKPKTGVGVHPHLVLTDPMGQTEKFVLNGNSHRLGRNPNCDLRLPDSWGIISKQHAVLEREGGNYRIYDGDRQNPSTNKIFINQTLVTPHEGYLLKDGDELKIGQDPNTQVTLTYSNPAPSQTVVAKSPGDRNSNNG